MRFQRLTETTHPLYGRAIQLYGNSFPYHEQREQRSQEEILRIAAYHFELICDGNDFVGMILYWENDAFIYVEHFCILPEKRNQQYGQRALTLLCQKGKTVILEIDPPADEISVRRKGFYERIGFVENPYHHTHPPYHKGCAGHELVVMSCPGRLTEMLYQTFKGYLARQVMKDACPEDQEARCFHPNPHWAG